MKARGNKGNASTTVGFMIEKKCPAGRFYFNIILLQEKSRGCPVLIVFLHRHDNKVTGVWYELTMTLEERNLSVLSSHFLGGEIVVTLTAWMIHRASKQNIFSHTH